MLIIYKNEEQSYRLVLWEIPWCRTRSRPQEEIGLHEQCCIQGLLRLHDIQYDHIREYQK